MAEKIRIPSTSVELVLILGVIFREHIKLSLQGTECWTFEHVADFSHISYNEGEEDLEVNNYLDIYLGSGYLHAYIDDGPVQKVETRVRCTHNQWVPCDESDWTFELWLKPENGKIMRYRYACPKVFSNVENIFLLNNENMPLIPPKKISFSNASDNK